MKENIKNLLTDNLIKYSIIFSLIISLIGIILAIVFFPKLPPFIPLFNSLPWGEKRLTDSSSILFLFLLFIFIVFINTFLSIFFYLKYPLISRLLSLTSFIFVLLGFLAFLQIIFLVF